MKSERLLQINVATMAALGVVLLGMGQNSVMLPLLGTVAAVASVCLTDVLGWVRLSRHTSNLAALAAVAAVAVNIATFKDENRLLAIANLLVYLQIVRMFEPKNGRVYRQVMVLSLVQVVVAAALHLGFEFGLLLSAYVVIGISAMVLSLLVSETAPMRTAVESTETGNWAGLFGRWAAPAGPLHRAFQCDRCHDPVEPALGRALVGKLAQLSVLTLVLGTLIFFALPRFGRTSWRGPGRNVQRSTGLPQEVSLNDWGRIVESDASALRMQLLDLATEQPLELADEPYVRGAVLYRYQEGKWKRLYLPSSNRGRPPAPHMTGFDVTVQEIRLEPGQGATLPGMYPVCRLPRHDPRVLWDDESRQLFRSQWNQVEQFRYRIGTQAVVDHRQIQLIPAEPRSASAKRAELQIPTENLPGLVELADEIIQRSGLPEEDRVGRARALLYHLNLPTYTYSLDLLPEQRTAGIDPVEDFVTNHRTGHCEYFASALALMLRSQGIPARLAIGYVGGEFNAVGEYYQFEQLHAHAWVEVYLAPEHLTGWDTSAFPPAGGAWMRLDATPAAGEVVLEGRSSGVFALLGQTLDYVQLLWSEYVLGLNSQRQRESIYGPLVDQMRLIKDRVFRRDGWRIGDWFGWLRGNWFNGSAALLAMATCMILAGLVWLVRLAIALLASLWRRRRPRRRRRAIRVDFYQRLEAMLRRYGLRRRATQTAQEFAAVAAAHLGRLPELRDVALLPAQLVDAYYEVRFGRRPLDNQRRSTLEQQLAQLESALKETRRR